MGDGMNVEQEMDAIKKCLEKGEKLDEKKMTMLFLFSFIQEERKSEIGDNG